MSRTRKPPPEGNPAYHSYECSVMSTTQGRYCRDPRCTSPRHETLLPENHKPHWLRKLERRQERERRMRIRR